jgi:recombination protein RecA
MMSSAATVRAQVEAALAGRIPGALTPAAKTIREVMPTGVAAVDEVLEGGLPVGAVTEMIGAECSGRTALALSFVAGVTRAERVCAWVDVSDALSPESAAAAGVELKRLLWVRCGVAATKKSVGARENFKLAEKYFAAPVVTKGLHGGGFGPHPRMEVKGLSDGVGALLREEVRVGARCAEPVRRERGRGERVEAVGGWGVKSEARVAGVSVWGRMEQAMRVTDLLLQAGGFSAIVLDMGSLAPEQVSRIPLATWFRYAAAAERSRASVVLLTQHGCSKSSAGLVLRLSAGEAEGESTVLGGLSCSVEVSRQRSVEAKVVELRKPPRRVSEAAWVSRATWAEVR